MKKIFLFITAFIVCLNFLPSLSSAASFEEELMSYFEDIDMSEEELNDFLEYFYDENIDSFSSVVELKEFLGEPINNDNLQKLIVEYQFKDEADLKDFLVENGEIDKEDNLNDVYRFINTLDETISFYIGTPITKENLKSLLEDYDMSYEELIELLSSNGDSIDQYKYIEDLDNAILAYTDDSEIFSDIFKEIGITDDEVENLLNHFMSIDMDEKMEQKLEAISERMMAIGDFESETDLSDDQIQEIIQAYQEILALFKLDAKFYLVKGTDKKPITLNELTKLETTNGYNLSIELYNYNGDFLADMMISANLFGSELITDTINKVEKVEKSITKPVKKTIKGGKLPNTAGHYVDNILGGLAMLIVGSLVLRRWRTKKI
ncbi:processed acidic surface protein [Heyndrickxia oleronia]|uniref:processed acidic surface protein n=1 Tax=Heyndrickxia oleronia TaxID=38875 RepID=UPI001AE00681|nr:processed acidic surface protein [Heyndrickxia oleronia]MEC1374111.1 processed acidic surface protein [Heyndrickxia oleronia]QQZ06297.1 processed acidic surface protein [Heyndrickxia oleronia]